MGVVSEFHSCNPKADASWKLIRGEFGIRSPEQFRHDVQGILIAMDALVSAALHEIAIEGTQGCSLQKLWAGLQGSEAATEIPLDARSKHLVWQQVLNVPGIGFRRSKSPGSQTLDLSHLSVESVEEAQGLGVFVVAPEGLRESCLGMYDVKLCDAHLSKDQRDILEHLAKARSHGVTQSQLGKDFKMGGNKMFYVVKSLEARGLVVRQATIVRSHSSPVKGKTVPIVATNLIHLTRYTKDRTLGSHSRFEVPSSSKSNVSDSGEAGQVDATNGTEELVINDDFPAMSRICEKLEAAKDKVLIVSDLKLSLNYRFAVGHRNWRRLAKRLQDASLVEVFNAQITGSKIVPCIRLLKPFDAKAFSGNDEVETDAQLRGAKRGQVTNQMVELSIDRQIYDLVDNAGREGLYMMDLWKQLGLNNKRNYYRVTNMLAKRCIVSEAEQHKRSMIYRLRTASKATLASTYVPPDVPLKTETEEPQSIAPLVRLAPPPLLSKGQATIRRRRKGKEKGKPQAEEETEKLDRVSKPAVGDEVVDRPLDENESQALTVVDMSRFQADEGDTSTGRSGKLFTCLSQTTTGFQRELRVMQRLQAEKFVPRVELHRWIEETEKERKGTSMDRKTLTRLLQKLQREGQLKCILLSSPGLTNCGRSRTSEVVLLPEVEVGPELLAVVHDRIRRFDMSNRGHGAVRVKAAASSVPVLDIKHMHPPRGIKRVHQSAIQTEEEMGRTLHANGFIPAKMVRVRMLHNFLWSYVNGILEYDDPELVPISYESSCKAFSLATAVQAMTVELFLQLIGSTRPMEELESYCRKRLRLCDLPEAECLSLTGRTASGRLSWLIDVLRRMKLIRLVMGAGAPLERQKSGFSRTSDSAPEALLIYAMEFQPYLEEPAPQPLSSLSLDAFDLSPRARHEFTMTSKESVEAYWQTLEYFYCGAMPTIARRAFPGSNVPEKDGSYMWAAGLEKNHVLHLLLALFGLRSWTSLRLMTLEQRTELMKRVEAGGGDKKMTSTECAALAKELNLSLEQVLRVSYEKNRRYRLQTLQKEKLENSVTSDTEVTLSRGHRIKPNINTNSRKRAVTSAAIMEVPHVRAYKRQREMELRSDSIEPRTSIVQPEILFCGIREEDNHVLNEDDGDEEEDEDRGAGENPFNYLTAVKKLKPTRCRRFPWSEDLDRILIGCYARQRAMLGARFHRVDWGLIPALPASGPACRRRISQLKAEPSVRKALMSLCSLLAARYTKHVQLMEAQETQGGTTDLLSDGSQAIILGSAHGEDYSNKVHNERTEALTSGQELPWDSSQEPAIAAAVNEVLRLRSVTKAVNSKRSAIFRSSAPKWPHQHVLDSVFPREKGESGAGTEHPGNDAPKSLTSMIEDSISATLPIVSTLHPVTTIDPLALSSAVGCIQHAEPSEGAQTSRSGAPPSSRIMNATRGRTRSVSVRIRKRRERPALLNEITSEEMVQRSLGIANAVELVKVVLLNSSSEAEVPTPVVDALRCCEEYDVFVAFNFLREQELVIVGQENQPFVLSPKFFHNASASRFPFGTGREALSTTQWLVEQEDALDQDWVSVPTDNLSGQLLQLLGVISEGEFTIAPFLPKDGVGESEDNRSVVVGVKRKTVAGHEVQYVKPKIQRAEAASPGFRRERGFPGIQVCLHRATKRMGTLLLAATSNEQESISEAPCTPEGKENMLQDGAGEEVVASSTVCAEAAGQAMDFEGDISPELSKCIQHFCAISEEITNLTETEGPMLKPSFLKAAMVAIEEAGSEGLSVPQLREQLTAIGLEVNEELAEACVCAVESFDLAKQVNAYDHVRVVAGRHSTRFCLQITREKPEGVGGEVAVMDDDLLITSKQSGHCSSHPIDLTLSENQGFGHLEVSSEEQADLGQENLEVSPVSSRGPLNKSGASSLATVSVRWNGLHSRTPPHVLKKSSEHRRLLLPSGNKDLEVTQTVPVLPWLNGEGGTNCMILQALSRRVTGIVMLNPGVTEDQLVELLDVLNPQTTRQLLKMLELDGHLIVRKLLQSKPAGPPRLLHHLINLEKTRNIEHTYRRHYYASVTSASLL